MMVLMSGWQAAAKQKQTLSSGEQQSIPNLQPLECETISHHGPHRSMLEAASSLCDIIGCKPLMTQEAGKKQTLSSEERRSIPALILLHANQHHDHSHPCSDDLLMMQEAAKQKQTLILEERHSTQSPILEADASSSIL